LEIDHEELKCLTTFSLNFRKKKNLFSRKKKFLSPERSGVVASGRVAREKVSILNAF
jgi:hypothetical protein